MLEVEPFKSVRVVTGTPTVVCGDNGVFLYVDLDEAGQLRTRLHPRHHTKLLDLQGQRVKATYHLRSLPSGKVLSHSQMVSVKPCLSGETCNRVEVTGKVVQMSKTDMMAVVRVFSEHLNEPFCVHVHGGNDMLNAALDFFSVRITGHVEGDGKLVADRMENTRVVIPEKFRGWRRDRSWMHQHFTTQVAPTSEAPEP